jgi:hypothetical protein
MKPQGSVIRPQAGPQVWIGLFTRGGDVKIDYWHRSALVAVSEKDRFEGPLSSAEESSRQPRPRLKDSCS